MSKINEKPDSPASRKPLKLRKGGSRVVEPKQSKKDTDRSKANADS